MQDTDILAHQKANTLEQEKNLLLKYPYITAEKLKFILPRS